eukprot:3936261-Amphidinium_carterae.1
MRVVLEPDEEARPSGTSSLDQGVGKEEHQGNHQTSNNMPKQNLNLKAASFTCLKDCTQNNQGEFAV